MLPGFMVINIPIDGIKLIVSPMKLKVSRFALIAFKIDFT